MVTIVKTGQNMYTYRTSRRFATVSPTVCRSERARINEIVIPYERGETRARGFYTFLRGRRRCVYVCDDKNGKPLQNPYRLERRDAAKPLKYTRIISHGTSVVRMAVMTTTMVVAPLIIIRRVYNQISSRDRRQLYIYTHAV